MCVTCAWCAHTCVARLFNKNFKNLPRPGARAFCLSFVPGRARPPTDIHTHSDTRLAAGCSGLFELSESGCGLLVVSSGLNPAAGDHNNTRPSSETDTGAGKSPRRRSASSSPPSTAAAGPPPGVHAPLPEIAAWSYSTRSQGHQTPSAPPPRAPGEYVRPRDGRDHAEKDTFDPGDLGAYQHARHTPHHPWSGFPALPPTRASLGSA